MTPVIVTYQFDDGYSETAAGYLYGRHTVLIIEGDTWRWLNFGIDRDVSDEAASTGRITIVEADEFGVLELPAIDVDPRHVELLSATSYIRLCTLIKAK